MFCFFFQMVKPFKEIFKFWNFLINNSYFVFIKHVFNPEVKMKKKKKSLLLYCIVFSHFQQIK